MTATPAPALDEYKVAIIIACYNAEGTILRAVESALIQDLPDAYALEVIVVDDCSTDTTADLVAARAKSDDRVTLIRQTKNGGPSAARNTALSATDAAWFTPLDSDDFMAKGRMSALLQTARNGQWDLVADNLIMSLDDAPETPVRHLWPTKPQGELDLTFALFVTQNLSTAGNRSELGYMKPLINRQHAGTGDLYRGDMRFGEDYDLYTRLLAGGAAACLLDPQGYYAVQRRNSLSRSQKAIDFARLIDTDKTLLATGNLNADETMAIRSHLRESQSEWVWLRAIEAFKARSLPAFLSCFFVTPAATGALIGKLSEQVIRRTLGRGQTANKQSATS